MVAMLLQTTTVAMVQEAGEDGVLCCTWDMVAMLLQTTTVAMVQEAGEDGVLCCTRDIVAAESAATYRSHTPR